jgi:hypothetical protein
VGAPATRDAHRNPTLEVVRLTKRVTHPLRQVAELAAFRLGTQLASIETSRNVRMPVFQSMQPEIIALLFPELAPSAEGPSTQVTALVRDAEGAMEVRHVRPDGNLLKRAMLTGRFNSGKPIVDPQTREVIGYEIEPLAAGW